MDPTTRRRPGRAQRGQPCTAQRHDPTPSAYSWWGCRCDGARKAYAAYQHAKRAGVNTSPYIDGRPTIERLRILAGLGYGWSAIGPHVGWSPPRASRMARQYRPRRVLPATAAKVAAAFNHLIKQPAPCGYAAAKALDNAMRAGWGVVDRVAVDLALAGCDVHLTKLEQAAVLHIGHARGLPLNEVAAAAHLSYTTATDRLGLARGRQEVKTTPRTR